ncbi:MAG TPA: sigma-70 family RNA polymerase sigma factor [Gemmatimonadales bacterium]|nr:sigma-70 family RNA polymerase sigma factor [Gemmatimonadales bacterium]
MATDRSQPRLPRAPAGAEVAPAERCREWYREHGAALYNYIRFYVASPEVAEDLTAETFLRALRAADRFDPAAGGARPWLVTIARNLISDHRRRARIRQYVPLNALRDLECTAPSPEERLLREEAAGRVLDAVASLGERDREIIGLRYGSGLDGAEVARLLGISAESARVRLWRALRRLRDALGE